MVHEIKGKVFLITGGSIGIGAQVVRNFLDEGAGHIAVLDVAEPTGIALQDELNAKYGKNKVKFYKCDVTKDEELFNAYDETIKSYGYIDVVVNNAGIMNDSEKAYKKEVEINVTALATSTFKALKIMRIDEGGKGGTIINISSIAALTQDIALPLYYATKSAVLQFSNCLGLDLNYQRTGVRMVTVCYGPTDTTLFAPNKLSSYDKNMEAFLHSSEELNAVVYLQKIETAAHGLVEAYKHSVPGGTWLSANDMPPEDITEDVKQAYQILGGRYRRGAEQRLKERFGDS